LSTFTVSIPEGVDFYDQGRSDNSLACVCRSEGGKDGCGDVAYSSTINWARGAELSLHLRASVKIPAPEGG
jgi:hypothetical protein